MKIKSIHLLNFQKHSDLKLDFNEDINIITGLSSTGKSCIRRAIAWVCFCENISENDVRKEGTKKTSVSILFDNEIELERVRSSSINRYILRKDEEESVYDSFGKELPEDIQLVLNMQKIEIDNESINLNIAEQLTLPFLLDKSPGFRAKLFNKLTGNEILDKTFKECNKESLRISRELKRNEELVKEQEDELIECSKKYKICKDKLTDVKLHYTKLKEDVEIYETLKELSDKLSKNKESQKEVKKRSKEIKIVSMDKIKSLEDKYIELEKLKNLFKKFKDIQNKLEELKNTKIKTVDINFEELKEMVVSLDKQKCLLNEIRDNEVKRFNNQENIEDFKLKLKQAEEELENIWKEQKICPLCKKEKH